MIKYRSRQILHLDEYLKLRPDIRSYYIYDTLLSSGDLLFQCSGGVGQTPERYIPRMYEFFKLKNSTAILRSVFESDFNSGWGKGTYLRVRNNFNCSDKKLESWRDCATLYLLWCASGFCMSYNKKGYHGRFKPSILDWAKLEEFSETLRSSFYTFRQAGVNTVLDSIVTSRVVIHARLPDSYGSYGSGFKWNSRAKRHLLSTFQSYAQCGYKICLVLRDYENSNVNKCYEPFLSTLNCDKISSWSRFSENFYTNF